MNVPFDGPKLIQWSIILKGIYRIEYILEILTHDLRYRTKGILILIHIRAL